MTANDIAVLMRRTVEDVRQRMFELGLVPCPNGSNDKNHLCDVCAPIRLQELPWRSIG